MAAFPSDVLVTRGAVSRCAVSGWPYLDQPVLLRTRSPKVCMTCHWFRHVAEGASDGIPLLTCQLHQGLIAHGAHLTSRCQGWTDDMVRHNT